MRRHDHSEGIPILRHLARNLVVARSVDDNVRQLRQTGFKRTRKVSTRARRNGTAALFGSLGTALGPRQPLKGAGMLRIHAHTCNVDSGLVPDSSILRFRATRFLNANCCSFMGRGRACEATSFKEYRGCTGSEELTKTPPLWKPNLYLENQLVYPVSLGVEALLNLLLVLLQTSKRRTMVGKVSN